MCLLEAMAIGNKLGKDQMLSSSFLWETKLKKITKGYKKSREVKMKFISVFHAKSIVLNNSVSRKILLT